MSCWSLSRRGDWRKVGEARGMCVPQRQSDKQSAIKEDMVPSLSAASPESSWAAANGENGMGRCGNLWQPDAR